PSAFFIPTLARPPTTTLFPSTTLFRSPLQRQGPKRAFLGQSRSGPSPRKTNASCTETGSETVPNETPAAASRQPTLPRREPPPRSEEHASELQSRFDLVCRLLLEKKKK